MALRKKSKEAHKDKPTPADFGLLLSPLLTEKSTLVSQRNTYLFRVPKSVSKDEIRSAVQRIFNVEVLRVNTLNEMGKMKRTARTEGRRASFKKAYVTVKQGQTINVVEGL